MKFNRKLMVIVTLSSLMITAVAATRKSSTDAHYTNLKVLPKNTSSKVLSHIMIDEFEDGLGVECGFCHAKENNSNKNQIQHANRICYIQCQIPSALLVVFC